MKKDVAKVKRWWHRFALPQIKFTWKVVVAIVLILLVLTVVIVAWRIYSVISQDLTIVLTPSTAALRTTHGVPVNASFTLKTNNYLFCKARCSYEFADLSNDKVLDSHKGILLENSNVTFSFELPTPSSGEGQLLYGLNITCANVENALCERAGTPHLTSALVTVDYSLDETERQKRDELGTLLPQLLIANGEIETHAIVLRAWLAFLQGPYEASLDGLEGDTRAFLSEQQRSAATLMAAVARWNDQQYVGLTVDLDDAAALENNGRDLRQRYEAYAATQRALVEGIEAELNGVWRLDDALLVLDAHGLAEERNRGVSAVAALTLLARGVEVSPATTVYTRLESLGTVQNKTGTLINEAHRLVITDLADGTALLDQELLRLNATSDAVFLPGMNGTPTGLFSQDFASLKALCLMLNDSASQLQNQNLTLLNETAAFLDRCSLLDGSFVESGHVDLRPLELPDVNATVDQPQSIVVAPPRCCAFGSCKPCCDTGDCTKKYPVLFLHGHSMNQRNAPEYTIECFTLYQRLLEEQKSYLDAGVLTPYGAYDPLPWNTWGRSPAPISVSGTYYYDAYLSGGSYILSMEKSESIDTYAIRTKDLVDITLQRTGSDKVIIVAHSMGGLVTRRYIQLFGESKVAGVIMIGTPNHGIESSVAKLCPLLGSDKECGEMTSGSAFLSRLNDPARQPTIPVAVIVGSGCDMNGRDGDGVVTVESATLPGASIYPINGSCGDEMLHTAILDPARYPLAYEQVRELIETFAVQNREVQGS